MGYGSPRRVLGVLNDTHVVVDFVCSDLCPSNTVRIVHYDLDPGARCTEVGGVEREALVPVAITARLQTFCVPAVLANNWATYFR
jgi:hypothetical protein